MTSPSAALLKKYNVAAPRYTSYPTVPYWETTPTNDEWLAHLRNAVAQNEKSDTGAAIYVHIPFCEKLCTFCGCNTRITKNHAVGAPYVENVLTELRLYQEALGDHWPIKVAEIHLGGGTPTFLSPTELRGLLQPLISSVELDGDREFSVEVDPRITTAAHFETLAEFGFRRVSLGVQDFDADVQESINRVQSFAQVAEVTANARRAGFTSINFDLIYGLPFQTRASIEQTFAKVLELRPDRIAFYAYAHVPWIKPTHRKFSDADLPSPDLKRSLYESGRVLLEGAGYREIGMDHFALPEDALWQAAETGSLHRNFMGYLPRRVAPLFGLGVSAISDSWSAFMQNEKIIEKYQARLQAGQLPILRGHVLTPEDMILRRHILNLMTQFTTDWSDPAGRLPLFEMIPDKVREMVADGLVELGDSSLTIRDEGRAFIRNISMAFDARLARKAPETSLFSKSI